MTKQSRLNHFHFSLAIKIIRKESLILTTSCMFAKLVCLQNRSWENSLGTSRASCLHALTVKIVPVKAFSGCAPRGLIGRPSLKVPVHSWRTLRVSEWGQWKSRTTRPYIKLWILLGQLLALLVNHHSPLVILPSLIYLTMKGFW